MSGMLCSQHVWGLVFILPILAIPVGQVVEGAMPAWQPQILKTQLLLPCPCVMAREEFVGVLGVSPFRAFASIQESQTQPVPGGMTQQVTIHAPEGGHACLGALCCAVLFAAGATGDVVIAFCGEVPGSQ